MRNVIRYFLKFFLVDDKGIIRERRMFVFLFVVVGGYVLRLFKILLSCLNDFFKEWRMNFILIFREKLLYILKFILFENYLMRYVWVLFRL